jgi:hypothetical protein
MNSSCGLAQSVICISFHWLLASLPTVSPDAWHLARLSSPHSHTARLNRTQRDLERPPRKKEPPLPPRFGMVAGTGRRGVFFADENNPFF